MKNSRGTRLLLILLLSFIISCQTGHEPASDGVANNNQETPAQQLPSWNDNTTKNRILEFIETVTDTASNDYVPPANRLAVFDNDGTLWSEYPHYFQWQFVFDRIVAMAPDHPRWKRDNLIQAVIKFDREKIFSFRAEGIYRLITITHSGMTTGEYSRAVKAWLKNARHPKTGKLYKEMVFQPMLELISLLQDNGFKVFIVTGGWSDFVRPLAEEVYGIPPEQVIGSRQELAYELVDGRPVLQRLPEIDFINDGDNKAIAIHQLIGKRPILAFGNSDGDISMLTWTTAGNGKRLSAFIHHTDSKREWAYDREAKFGRLDKGLDEARQRGWLRVDMKKDWRVVYPFALSDSVTAIPGN